MGERRHEIEKLVLTIFRLFSEGSDEKIDKIGTGVLAASLPPQTLGPRNLLIPFLSPISIV